MVLCRSRSDHQNSLGMLCAVCLALSPGCSLTIHFQTPALCHSLIVSLDPQTQYAAESGIVWQSGMRITAFRQSCKEGGGPDLSLLQLQAATVPPLVFERIMCTMQAPLHAVRSWQR